MVSYDNLWSMASVTRNYLRSDRSAEEIQKDIDKAKAEADLAVDLNFAEKRSYCLINLMAIYEKEMPILELHVISLDAMPERVKASPEWYMEKEYATNRLVGYRASLADYEKELEETKTKLKEYKFNKDKVELEAELAELNDIKVIDKKETTDGNG